jgi:hypothetical protein
VRLLLAAPAAPAGHGHGVGALTRVASQDEMMIKVFRYLDHLVQARQQRRILRAGVWPLGTAGAPSAVTGTPRRPACTRAACRPHRRVQRRLASPTASDACGAARVPR